VITIQPTLWSNPIIGPSPRDAGSPVWFCGSPNACSLGQGIGQGTPPYNTSWDFGDGSTSFLQSVRHAYASPGSYTVHFRVSDSAGESSFNNTTLTIGPQLDSTFHSSSPWILLGQSVTFSAQASRGHPGYFYGYTGLPPGCASTNSTSLQCVPTQSGSYTVTAEISDALGGWANRTVSLTVTIPIWDLVVPIVVASLAVAVLVAYKIGRSRGRPQVSSPSKTS
jgi:PKD repeat protein